VKDTDGAYLNNYIKNASFKFLYQYNYKDYQVSALSTHSDIIPFAGISSTGNRITVTIPAGEIIPDDVQTIDIVVKINDEPTASIVKTFDRAKDDFAAHNAGTTQLSYYFYNDTIGVALDSIQSTTSFHNVPLKSKTLTYAKNRLFLANNTSGYDTPTKSSLSVAAGPVTSTGGGTITTTWKYTTLRFTYNGLQQTTNIYYAYDANGGSKIVYFYLGSKAATTPPASFQETSATTIQNSEINFAYWYMRTYPPPAGNQWDYTYTISYTATASTVSIIGAINPLDGVSVFKTGSTI
jgi:hypothetical protein